MLNKKSKLIINISAEHYLIRANGEMGSFVVKKLEVSSREPFQMKEEQ